ncbi:MAG TPA: hypothetical protein PLV07_09740, partial [Acidiphilium sp.]|nr:hypothetical protein [Acidiphilium sp.]
MMLYSPGLPSENRALSDQAGLPDRTRLQVVNEIEYVPIWKDRNVREGKLGQAARAISISPQIRRSAS